MPRRWGASRLARPSQVDWKNSCRLVATSNLTLSGEQTVDGASAVQGDRVLVVGQTASEDNGIYSVSTGTWRRSVDFDAGTEVTAEATVRVSEGSTYAGTMWSLRTADPITVGTDAQNWSQELGPGSSSGVTGVYACPASVAIRDAVYQTGADSVDKADATSDSTAPCIGLVISKPSSTSCVVSQSGELVGFSGLTPGATQFLSTTAGALTETAPATLGNVVQNIGFAKDTASVFVTVDRDFITL